MAQITKAMAQDHVLSLRARLVPDDIRARIPQAELHDRIVYSAHVAKAAAASNVPARRRELTARSAAILRARPRDEVERQVAQLVAKAAALERADPARRPQADAMRREARDILETDPPAPRGGIPAPEDQALGGTTGMGQPRRTGPAAALPADGPQAALPGDVPGRTVIKAAAALQVLVYDRRRRPCAVSRSAIRTRVAKAAGDKDPMVPVFDADGNLIGVCSQDDIEPLAQASAPGKGTGAARDPEPAAAPAPSAAEAVVKATFAAENRGRPHMYARDVRSATGACLCAAALRAPVHTHLAPGIPQPRRPGTR